MPFNLRHTVMAGSACALLLLLAACGSANGTKPPAPAPVPVSISVCVQGAVSVTLGSTAQYAATVGGTKDQSVTWMVDQIPGGNAQLGTISTAGLYAAPAAIPGTATVSIAAASAADPGVSSSISVALQAPPVVTAPTPATATAAARFLDQTSFGPTAAGIAHVQQIGLQAALVEQFNQPATLFSQPPFARCRVREGKLSLHPVGFSEGDRVWQRPIAPARCHGFE